MHDCRKFRENWIGGSCEERPACLDCRRFCEETHVFLKVLEASSEVPDETDPYWNDLSTRLRTRLMEENIEKRVFAASWKWTASLVAAATIVLGVGWATTQLLRSAAESLGEKQAGHVEFVDDHIEGLDARVVAYMGQSELFLREFTKIEPTHTEDIEDSRIRASRDLAELPIQRTAAGDFAPVRITLEEYESVLRDIKNLESPEDILDIQSRIRRNGLIANFKAYQPRVVFVSQR